MIKKNCVNRGTFYCIYLAVPLCSGITDTSQKRLCCVKDCLHILRFSCVCRRRFSAYASIDFFGVKNRKEQRKRKDADAQSFLLCYAGSLRFPLPMPRSSYGSSLSFKRRICVLVVNYRSSFFFLTFDVSRKREKKSNAEETRSSKGTLLSYHGGHANLIFFFEKDR